MRSRQEIDAALGALLPRAARRRRRGVTFRKVGWALALLPAFAVLPFYALVRVAVHLYLDRGLDAWLALGASAGVAFVLLGAYALGFSAVFRRRVRVPSFVFKAAAACVGAYCLYALLFISAANVKVPELRETFTALHPLLRLSVSTLVLADGDLVLTDGERERADYARMGLPVNERSLHYRQADGYGHAVDLRTNGRPEWRNRLVQAYFQALGLHTLRHVGTADHLHVALPLREE